MLSILVMSHLGHVPFVVWNKVFPSIICCDLARRLHTCENLKPRVTCHPCIMYSSLEYKVDIFVALFMLEPLITQCGLQW